MSTATPMSAATYAIVDPAHAQPSMSYLELALGLVIIAIIPALFWTGVIWMIASSVGFALSWVNLASVALAIATPPTCIWAAVAVRE